MEKMTNEQALNILIAFRQRATGPFSGQDFDLVSQALQVISELVKPKFDIEA